MRNVKLYYGGYKKYYYCQPAKDLPKPEDFLFTQSFYFSRTVFLVRREMLCFLFFLFDVNIVWSLKILRICHQQRYATTEG